MITSVAQLENALQKLAPMGALIAENADRTDSEARWPKENLQLLQKEGFGGLCVPQDLGGMGFGLLALAQSCELIGQNCASTAMCYGMHVVGSAVIAAKATASQQEQFLRPIAEGKHLTTLALSEPGSGSHFYFPETTLSPLDGNFYRLKGDKSFVTNGSHADSMVVSAVTEAQGTSPGRFSCVVVERGAEGLTWKEPWNGLGMRGNASRAARLENLKVPRANLLGQEGDQIWYVFEVVAPYFLTAMAGTYLGVATAALNEAIAHLKLRSHSHSGLALADQPLLQHRVGTLWSELAAARELVHKAAKMGEQGSPDSLPYFLSAKAQTGEAAVHITNEAMTLMGGISYAEGSKLGRHLRDARASHVMAPTTDILHTWTGRALLGKPLLGE